MAWIQKFTTALWAALVVLLSTRAEWIVLFVMLVVVEIIITPIYAPQHLAALPRTLLGYAISVVIFLAFLNAYMDIEWLELVMMASISMVQIQAIVDKMGPAHAATKVWSDLKTHIVAWIAGRLNEIKNDERRKNLPPNNSGNGEDGDQDGGHPPGKPRCT